MTSVAVNSALQRAHATMQHLGQNRPRRPVAPDAQTASLLDRYVRAWEMADSTALVALLRDDVALTMPPLPVWYRGRDAIQWFLDNRLFAQPDLRLRLKRTQANGSPAFGVYQSDETGVYRPAALHVLTLEGGQISEINDFLNFDEQLFSKFGLPISG